MKLKFNNKMVEKILYIFFTIMVITYWTFPYFSILKYVSIMLTQILFIIIICKNKDTSYNKKIILFIVIISVALITSALFNFSISGLLKTFTIIDVFVFAYLIYPKVISLVKINKIKVLEIISDSFFIGLLLSLIFFSNDFVLSVGRTTNSSIRYLYKFGFPSIVGLLCFIEFTTSSFLAFFYKKEGVEVSSLKKKLCVFKIILAIYMIGKADIRTALLSVFIYIMIFILENNKKMKPIIITVFGTIAIVCFFILLAIDFINFETLDKILSNRLIYYKQAINEVIENGNVLIGEGSFRNTEVTTKNKIQVDNCFIDLFYQYGLIVVIPVVVFMCYIYKKINYFAKLSNNLYSNFVKTLFTTVLIYSLFEKNLFAISSALSVVTFFIVFQYIYEEERKLRML